MAGADAGVVDQHVDRPHVVDRLREGHLYLFHARHVGIEHPTQLRQLLGNPSSRLGVAIEDTNGAAFFQKARRGGLAYATGSTGHQHVFAHQTTHWSLPVTRFLNVSSVITHSSASIRQPNE